MNSEQLEKWMQMVEMESDEQIGVALQCAEMIYDEIVEYLGLMEQLSVRYAEELGDSNASIVSENVMVSPAHTVAFVKPASG